MVDVHTYIALNPHAVFEEFDGQEPLFALETEDNAFEGDDYWPVQIGNTEAELSWETLVMLPPTTMGFDMVEHRWGNLYPTSEAAGLPVH